MVFERVDKGGLQSWHVLAFIAFAVALGAILLFYSTPTLGDYTDLTLFDEHFTGYHFEEAEELLIALGEEGRSTYASSYTLVDTLFSPFLYLAIGSMFLWLTNPRRRFSLPLHENIRLIVVALCVVGFACDIAENISVWIMLGSGEEPPTAMVALGGIATSVKWLALAGAVAGLVATFLLALIRGASGGQEATA